MLSFNTKLNHSTSRMQGFNDFIFVIASEYESTVFGELLNRRSEKEPVISEVVLSASSMMMTLCFESLVRETVDAKFLALFLTVSKNLPSSDPLIT